MSQPFAMKVRVVGMIKSVRESLSTSFFFSEIIDGPKLSISEALSVLLGAPDSAFTGLRALV